MLAIIALLSITAAVYYGGGSGTVSAHGDDGSCIHDTPEIQRMLHTGMDTAEPQPGELDDDHNGQQDPFVQQKHDNNSSNHRSFTVQSVDGIRIVFKTSDLYDSTKYCTSSSGTVPDFKGSTAACQSQYIFTAAKRSILVNKILPQVASELKRYLKVKRLTSPLRVPSCRNWYVSNSDKNPGVPDADFVLYMSAAPTTAVAWASFCSTNTAGRTIYGGSNFNPKFIEWDYSNPDSAKNRELVDTGVHEVMHALGLSGYYFRNGLTFFNQNKGYNSASDIYKDVTVRGGHPIRQLVMPNVKREWRNYLGCQTTAGPEVEYTDDASGGSSGSHWNRRTNLDDTMNPTKGETYVTRLTLAYFEDTGHYFPDYSEASDKARWGKNAGCDFVTKKCNTVAGGKGRYFCTSPSDENHCWWNHGGLGMCWTSTSSTTLPSWGQYFASSTTKRGALKFMDYCPVLSLHPTGSCQQDKSLSTYHMEMGFYYGSSSRCFTTNDNFKQKGSLWSNNRPQLGRCFQTRCVSGTRVQFKVGTDVPNKETEWIDCPVDGSAGTVTMPSTSKWSGTVQCPTAEAICDESIRHGSAPPTPSPPTPSPPTPAPVTPSPGSPPSPPSGGGSSGTNCHSNNHLTGSSPSTIFTTSAINDILDSHNEARLTVTPTARRVMPMVKWNQALADLAQKAIKSCRGVGLTRRNQAGFNEIGLNQAFKTRFWFFGKYMTAETMAEYALKKWLSQENSWTYDKVGKDCASGQVCTSYTQMIWAKSTDVGCGFIYCRRMRSYIFICLYGEAGSKSGKWPYLRGGTSNSQWGTCAPGAQRPLPQPEASPEEAQPSSCTVGSRRGFNQQSSCIPKCTNEEFCFGRGLNVSGTDYADCDCGGCLPGYEDFRCDWCQEGYWYDPKDPSYAPPCYRICTNSMDCNGNAAFVSGNLSTSCACQCKTGYVGENCGECAHGYSGYPNCAPKCTIAANCNGNADNVTGDVASGCTCSCSAGFSGSSCDVCSLGFVKFPQCYRSCTNATDCSARASTVSGDDSTGCTCGCLSGYAGELCELCDAGFEGYPHCVPLCTVEADCNGRADSVLGRRISGCSCACQASFAGSTCDQCADGYFDYPSCFQKCTVERDCSDHASSVAGGVESGCACTCLTGYSGAKCDQCSSTHTGYPDCEQKCTVETDCSNHATSVSGTQESGCTCQCAASFTGPTCASCDDGYNGYPNCARICPEGRAGPTCEECAPGYGGPSCLRQCSIEADCSSNAIAVSGLVDSCQCTCKNMWSGSKCDVCPARFNANLDCGACASWAESYPSCFGRCTVLGNCSGHASGVIGNSNTGCDCSCSDGWTGVQCETCPPQYAVSKGCASCAPGFAHYPDCFRTCTVAADCSGPSAAHNVTGLEGSCSCSCRHGYSGTNCGQCAEGFNGFPSCAPKCSIVVECSNRAVNVTGNRAIGCQCECRNGWTGADCSVCPTGLDMSEDCGACIDGFGGYPNCRRECDVERDCDGHADAAFGLEGDCQCSCRNGWGGIGVQEDGLSGHCDSCPDVYNMSNDCGTCADGYDDYPSCQRHCTLMADCSNNADSVTGNELEGCECECRNAWFGPSCSLCPTSVNETDDCGSCLPGFDGFPSCEPLCTNTADCGGRADAVYGVRGNCLCVCSDQWYGNSCDLCDARYDQASCSSCASGFESFPYCFESCTIATDCSGHATAVTGNKNSSCTCTCSHQWFGASCEICPPAYDGAQNCAACASPTTSTPYPSCDQSSALCSIAADCSGHAVSVSGGSGSCVCNCAHSWTGADCSQCPSRFSGSSCDTCATGFDSFPECYKSCDMSVDCNSRATGVIGNNQTGCQCTCENKWQGTSCEFCPPNFAGENCDTCASGFVNFPECSRQCTDETDCNGNAESVTGLESTGCKCVCKEGYSGPSCGACAPGYSAPQPAASAETSSQTPSTERPPRKCSKTCSVEESCSGHATYVNGTEATGCKCLCRNQWEGARCDQCKSIYNKSTDCGTCRSGLLSYPQCEGSCSIKADCNGRANSVSGIAGFCTCQCRHQWTGADCGSCPLRFSRSQDCGACAPGFQGYPACRPVLCTIDANCSGNANAVSQLQHDAADTNVITSCSCKCRNSWTGVHCDQCPANISTSDDCGACLPGYQGYPHCRKACSVKDDCGANAISVRGHSGACHCLCRTGYVGARCDRCANGFAQISAAPTTCARLCTAKQNCTDHAVRVSGNDEQGCSCSCRNQWKGVSCDVCDTTKFSKEQDCGACAPGLDGYPSCNFIVSRLTFIATLDLSDAALPATTAEFRTALVAKINAALEIQIDPSQIRVNAFDRSSGVANFSFVGSASNALASRVIGDTTASQLGFTRYETFASASDSTTTARDPTTPTAATDDNSVTLTIVGIFAGVLVIAIIAAAVAFVLVKKSKGPKFDTYSKADHYQQFLHWQEKEESMMMGGAETQEMAMLPPPRKAPASPRRGEVQPSSDLL